jgi:hypothetical protein
MSAVHTHHLTQIGKRPTVRRSRASLRELSTRDTPAAPRAALLEYLREILRNAARAIR